jgi:hypothetical protein
MTRKLWLLAAAMGVFVPSAAADDVPRPVNALRELAHSRQIADAVYSVSCLGDPAVWAIGIHAQTAARPCGEGRCRPVAAAAHEEIHATYAREMQIRRIIGQLLSDARQCYDAGNLDAARALTECASRLQADGVQTHHTRNVMEIPARARARMSPPAGDSEECDQPAEARPAGMSPRGCETCVPESRGMRPSIIPVSAHHAGSGVTPFEIPWAPVTPCPITAPTEHRRPISTNGPLRPWEQWAMHWEDIFHSEAVPAGVVRTPDGGIEVHTPAFRATAERVLVNPNASSEILLDGKVDLQPRTENQPARILTQRAIVNLRDGSYELLPDNVERFRPVGTVPATTPQRVWR